MKKLRLLSLQLQEAGFKSEAKQITLLGKQAQYYQQNQNKINPAAIGVIQKSLGLRPNPKSAEYLSKAVTYLSAGITPQNLLLAGLTISSLIPGGEGLTSIINRTSSPAKTKEIANAIFQQRGKIKAVFDRLKNPKIANYISRALPYGQNLVKYADRMFTAIQDWIQVILTQPEQT